MNTELLPVSMVLANAVTYFDDQAAQTPHVVG